MHVQPLDPAQAEAFGHCLSRAFGSDHAAADEDALRALLEVERAFAALDGTELVGTIAAYSLEVTVPGATMPMGGTTMVSVLPTHRRRGALAAMMAAHLREVRERGEAIAGLWASESSIYQRYGFGVAAHRQEVTIARPWSGLRVTPAPAGPVRLLDVEEARRLLPAIYEQQRPLRPGMLARSEVVWHHHHFRDDESEREGGSSLRFAIVGDPADPAGYVRFRHHPDWRHANAAGSVRVIELVGVGRQAQASLWSFLLGIDLAQRVKAWNLAPDDGIGWMLAEPRRAKWRSYDSLWVRLIDIAAALSGRRYRVPGRLVLTVADAQVASNHGTFELVVAADGSAECKPGGGPADVELGIVELSALFLGGASLAPMVAAGAATATPEIVRAVDAMFGWTPAPWCPEIF